MEYLKLKIGSKVETKHERAINAIQWVVTKIHTEPAINGRYLTISNGFYRDKVIHESSRLKIVSI